ncbi:MAG: hypothetical protein GXP33_07355 [Spirochaetes bacterium]|nr:hypothetical protein [Spirochaetota bacterium]
MKKLFLFISITLVLMTFLSCANVKTKGKTVTVTGIIRIEGNEPHTAVILKETKGKKARYLLEGKLAAELRADYQHKTVTITGYITGPASLPLYPEKIRVIKILKILKNSGN